MLHGRARTEKTGGWCNQLCPDEHGKNLKGEMIVMKEPGLFYFFLKEM